MKIVWSLLLVAISCQLSAQSVEKLKKVADDYYDAGRYLEAADFYEKVISLSPDDIESRYRQAFSYLKSTNYNIAETKFARLSLIPGSHQPSSIYYHGFLTKIKGDFSRLAHQVVVKDEYVNARANEGKASTYGN